MISVADALTMVRERAQPRPAAMRASAEAMGHTLAQDVIATVDSPPHDKALVDGYAIRSSDVPSASASLKVFKVLEEVTAGQVPSHTLVAGTATRIMTGAPIPAGADAVVMIEHTETNHSANGGESVRLRDEPVARGQNILRRGESMRVGDKVLKNGHAVRAIEIGLLAELGIEAVRVFQQPRVAILATGNELVPSTEVPQAGQIRNSNGPMLHAMSLEAHAQVVDLGIARDNEEHLKQHIRRGLESDVLLLSGGVSAGVLDLVPAVLQQLGVRQVFHKVELKPGKPLWFGILENEGQPTKLVFGLPGNPVSGLVCFYLFVRPAIARMAGRTGDAIQKLPARLAKEFVSPGNRPTYFPGRVVQGHDELLVEPLPWRGSADLRTLTDANALIYFPPGAKRYFQHELVSVYLL